MVNEVSVWYINNIGSVRTQFLISDFSQFFQRWRRGFAARNSKITNKDRDHAKFKNITCPPEIWSRIVSAGLNDQCLRD